MSQNQEFVKVMDARDWLERIHRGGNYAHFWRPTDRSGISGWFAIGDEEGRRRAYRELSDCGDCDMYVSVNPSYQIPPCNKSGNTNPRYIAKQVAYIQCVNVLFSEYDGKDYVTVDEYRPYLPADYDQLDKGGQRTAKKIAKEIAFYFGPTIYKERAMAAVRACRFTPTVVVDSGGGWHCYWFLSDTVYIDDSNRADVIDCQHGWVKMNGGDMGAADISRVLRVPGTRNCKDGFGARKPLVTVIEYNPTLEYNYADLEAAVMDWQMEQHRLGHDVHDATSDADRSGTAQGTVRAAFNAKYSCVKLLEKKGYSLVCQNKDKAGAVALTRMARPGKTTPSVTIFPANSIQPEVAIMWSGNDELHSELVNTKREGRDAFKIFAALYCDGDGKVAWETAKRHLGMWR